MQVALQLLQPPTVLSRIVSCVSAVIQIRIRIVRCERRAKRQRQKPCDTKAHVFRPFLLVGSKESRRPPDYSSNLCPPKALAI